MDKLSERRRKQEREIVHMDLQELVSKLAASIKKTDMDTQELREVQEQLLDIYLRFQ